MMVMNHLTSWMSKTLPCPRYAPEHVLLLRRVPHLCYQSVSQSHTMACARFSTETITSSVSRRVQTAPDPQYLFHLGAWDDEPGPKTGKNEDMVQITYTICSPLQNL
jgi:hypothetical protein